MFRREQDLLCTLCVGATKSGPGFPFVPCRRGLLARLTSESHQPCARLAKYKSAMPSLTFVDQISAVTAQTAKRTVWRPKVCYIQLIHLPNFAPSPTFFSSASLTYVPHTCGPAACKHVSQVDHHSKHGPDQYPAIIAGMIQIAVQSTRFWGLEAQTRESR